MDGSSQQCTQTTVSKSTFDNYSCSADVAVSKTCTRDTQITGHYENQVSTKTVVISPATLVFTKIDDNTLDLRCRWMNRGHHAGRFNHHIAKKQRRKPVF
jgi:conjugal transfer mating pair stabilization protein TraN